ncbi:hypothetical protein MMC20_003703 [Loxospora ochrophaea]|nr:hypothetical protein [Loxospora ochrophaea]
MVGMFTENGPCEVVEISESELGTQAREWGWDRSSNVLFIDQPNQAGFSYDTPTNGTLNLLSSNISIPPASAPDNQPAYTFLQGTFSSSNANATSNTTDIAAHTIWHMLQGFLGAFPQYNPGTRPNGTQAGVVGVNLFAESYGGKYGPAFAAFWEHQNAARRNGSIPSNTTLEIQLTTLGIMQGCIDDVVQGRYYPIFANNNTYGIQALSEAEELNVENNFLNANGCQQLIESCRQAMNAMDPQDDGDVMVVNQICQSAQSYCEQNVIGPYQSSGRDVYDVSQMTPDPFPPSTYLEYLNSANVQAAIGAVINYTESSTAVANAFESTGDYERGDHIAQMSYLLSLGVRVALVYGDRDYICNWLGGEAASFSIAAQSQSYSSFYSAGYAEIVVNSTYVGGVVRQYGNLSFSRIYDSGHLIPAYQPETAFTLFTRIIMGTDLSTGEPADLSSFATSGSANATHTNTAPDQFAPICWIRNINSTCNDEQILMIENGHGSIINGVLYDEASDWQAPAASVSGNAGVPGTVPISMTATAAPSSDSSPGPITSPPSTSSLPTGVYVATFTPTMTTTTKGAAPSRDSMNIAVCIFGFLVSVLPQWLM